MSLWQKTGRKIPKRHFEKPKKQQEVYVGSPAILKLSVACNILGDAFGNGRTYMVGSATERMDWRDVDVVHIMDNKQYERIFGKELGNHRLDARWSFLCMLVSKYLSDASGLPVDFKFQSITHANKEHGKKRRVVMGIYIYQERREEMDHPPEKTDAD
jgi:hypothetical protein